MPQTGSFDRNHRGWSPQFPPSTPVIHDRLLPSTLIWSITGQGNVGAGMIVLLHPEPVPGGSQPSISPLFQTRNPCRFYRQPTDRTHAESNGHPGGQPRCWARTRMPLLSVIVMTCQSANYRYRNLTKPVTLIRRRGVPATGNYVALLQVSRQLSVSGFTNGS